MAIGDTKPGPQGLHDTPSGALTFIRMRMLPERPHFGEQEDPAFDTAASESGEI